MCEDVQRLSRLIQASKRYLAADGDDGLRVSLVEIPSLNNLVASLLEDGGP
jgi:hypothetical protein